MSWIEPIWQRTKADVDYATFLRDKIANQGWDALSEQEQTDWNNGPIACLDYWDLNRIEQNTQYLADLLYGYGYTCIISTKPDWVEGDIQTAGEMERIRQNVDKLIDAFHAQSVVLPGTLNYPDHLKINDIENILRLMKEMIGRMVDGFRYCGTFHCGQEMILP